jgi:hypothetical protein
VKAEGHSSRVMSLAIRRVMGRQPKKDLRVSPARVSTPQKTARAPRCSGQRGSRLGQRCPARGARRRDGWVRRRPSPAHPDRSTISARRLRRTGRGASQPKGRPRPRRDSKRLTGCTRHPSFAGDEARHLARSRRFFERGSAVHRSLGRFAGQSGPVGALSKGSERGEVSVGTDGPPIERGDPLPGPMRQGCCCAQLAALVRNPSRDGDRARGSSLNRRTTL